ncbi:NAD(P)/FAD-dependent oxidoreductase [Autumnicola musiva]|uniref:FAD-dependent oxidoreductase n=1 Tax=Autumnicola musiva TaxID=3075589 RepID=A0ABU3D8W1_9FLAO|nr:FAD-dependent oxidoreductase [Zunongwangia sp. F117]MDT0677964.1 FAD-dependent oxidoreductase [Zunongwangia sp. F117]
MKKVVVIGGGISGLCSSYYLLKEGFEVSVIDKGDLTEGASNINAGYSTPSHIISLAAPGMINKGLKWMFDSSSPFYIKPRLDLQFLDWAWKFKKSAKKAKVEQSIPVLKELSVRSQNLYEELRSSVNFESHYEKKGLLNVFMTQKAADEELEKAERVKMENLELEILSRNQVLNLQPGLSEDVLGAVHYTCDSHSTPNDFMLKLKDWLSEHGVVFHLNESVKELYTMGEKIEKIKTNKDIHNADFFVMAAGTWTQQLARQIGVKIPLQGGKGYSLNVYRDMGIDFPTILTEAKVAVTPMDGFTRFSGTMEFSGNNTFIRKNRISAIADAAKLYYKDVHITEGEMANARSGLRPVSPDGLPYIGKTSKYNNMVIAAGHAMIGWSLGAVTGKLVSEVITGKKTSVDIAPLRPERF